MEEGPNKADLERQIKINMLNRNNAIAEARVLDDKITDMMKWDNKVKLITEVGQDQYNTLLNSLLLQQVHNKEIIKHAENKIKELKAKIVSLEHGQPLNIAPQKIYYNTYGELTNAIREGNMPDKNMLLQNMEKIYQNPAIVEAIAKGELRHLAQIPDAYKENFQRIIREKHEINEFEKAVKNTKNPSQLAILISDYPGNIYNDKHKVLTRQERVNLSNAAFKAYNEIKGKIPNDPELLSYLKNPNKKTEDPRIQSALRIQARLAKDRKSPNPNYNAIMRHNQFQIMSRIFEFAVKDALGQKPSAAFGRLAALEQELNNPQPGNVGLNDNNARLVEERIESPLNVGQNDNNALADREPPERALLDRLEAAQQGMVEVMEPEEKMPQAIVEEKSAQRTGIFGILTNVRGKKRSTEVTNAGQTPQQPNVPKGATVDKGAIKKVDKNPDPPVAEGKKKWSLFGSKKK